MYIVKQEYTKGRYVWVRTLNSSRTGYASPYVYISQDPINSALYLATDENAYPFY
jgi:hypothetical protein